MPIARIAHALASRLIERRLGGYRQPFHRDDASRPSRATSSTPSRRVAVLGGGIAGLSASSVLASRGLDVTLMERNAYLGGKIGAWTVDFGDGTNARADHGFHAFFANYYNLRALIDRAGVSRRAFVPITDYAIVRRDGRVVGFRDVDRTPLLNLLSLSRTGVLRKRDLVLDRSLQRLEPFLQYDREKTIARFDHVSFQQFADETGLPADLRLVFNTFARAFFTEPSRISLAELIKSFHFYYLSNDAGLLYEYLADDHGHAFADPIAAHLRSHGTQIVTGRAVQQIDRAGDAFVVDGAPFDHVVLACDVPGTRAILDASTGLTAGHPTLATSMHGLGQPGRYVVVRVWIDRDAGAELPVFVITDGELLDSITAVHRIAPEARAWAAAHAGAVFELHCYAVPDAVTDADLAPRLIEELRRFLPPLRDARVLHRHVHVRRDFASFATGQAALRPAVRTAVDGLFLAGDWVDLPRPAMLMEAAAMSGVLAANGVLDRVGLRQEPVWSVPPRGLLAW